MRCAACGVQNPPHRRFCGECGAALDEACPSCGAAREPGTKFCGDCGHRFASAGDGSFLAAPASIPAAERRVCSILFCDLVGFTPLSEARDPEEVRELLSSYFDAARMVIGRYGGTVEKFIGDAVMAVWGAPTAEEGDTERAVRAALDLVDAVVHLGQQLGISTLAARAGVVTGEVAVTIGAVGQGMVAGDPVNTAARTQAAAEPGSVLVDEGTWRAARGAVMFTPVGERALKGKSDPARLWRAERVVSGVGGSQRMDGLEAPLVGRDAELRLIKELFHASADRHSARLVSVIGPAGVGKSRLGWEFEKYIDGLASVVYWHRGRCLSYGDGVAFWALAEMVRQRLNIAEEDATSVVAQKLTAGLDAWVPDAAAREYVRPQLARLLGVDVSGTTASREELFAGWRLFFEQLAEAAPVVLLVEDAHFADAGLLDFLEHLLDWTRDAPIFVLTLARSDLLDRRSGWGGGRRNGTALSLEPLDYVATQVMLDGLVPGMPEPAKLAIAAQAQGIPLYAVETVRMLIDRDVVQPLDGAYRLVADVGELAVPDSLQSLLAARLDTLDPNARRLVGDAAVLGSRFPADALIAVSEQPPDEVRRQLIDLVRREVLTVSADPLSPERGSYGFVQTMVRQVAYETLSRRERKARHLRVAAHLQRVFADGGEEVSEVIAQHLLDALAAVPDDSDVPDLRRQGAQALRRAAERSQRTGAPAVAARAYAAAARLFDAAESVDEALTAARLDELAGDAATVAGDLAAAAEHYRAAADRYRRHGTTRDAARASVGQGRALRRHGRFDEAGPLLREALAALADQPDEDTVTALYELASLESSAGRDASDLYQQALDHAQSLGLSGIVIADLFVGQAIAHELRNRPAQAAALFAAAVTLAEGNDDAVAIKALLNLADLLTMTHDTAAAATAAGKAVSLCRRLGERWMLRTAVTNLVLALILMGEWDAAATAHRGAVEDGLGEDAYVAVYGVILEVLRIGSTPVGVLDAVEGIADSQDPQDQHLVALARALDAIARGDTAAVLAHARNIVAYGEGHFVGEEAIRWGWPIAADAALALGELAEAQRLLDWLDAHPRGHVPPLLRAERARIGARLKGARRDLDAYEAYADAVTALRQLGSPYHLAVGLLDFAEHLGAQGDAEQARAVADEAAVIAERLGAQPLLRRAGAAVPLQAAPTR